MTPLFCTQFFDDKRHGQGTYKYGEHSYRHLGRPHIKQSVSTLQCQ